MNLHSYDNYNGSFNINHYVDPVKKCHQIIKNLIIYQFSSNIYKLIDIGSGRGHDYNAWLTNNIKYIIALEPSETSIMSSIKKYIKNSKINKYPNIIYIRAIGNDLWFNGDAGLDDKSKKILKNTFNNKNNKLSVLADNIHMFWTIHYCISTKQDFLNLFQNINKNLKIGGKLIILSMNGKLIHKLLQKNNGSYKNITKDNQNLFQINAYYNYQSNSIKPYGNIIGVKLAGTYGLDNEILENLVVSKFLISFFQKNNYDLILKSNFIDYANNNNLDCIKSFNIFQKRISVFYDIIILQKK